MYQSAPISDRIARIRQKYRTTKPAVDLNRYKLVTEFYQGHPELTGILRKAYSLKNLFDNMPTPIWEDELIVGYPAETYRGCAVFPETSITWLHGELDNLENRGTDPYDITEETREYIRNTLDYWDTHCNSALVDAYYPEEFKKVYSHSRVLTFSERMNSQSPIGHYCGNFWKVVDPGLAAIRDEARAKITAMLEKGLQGDDGRKYEFYKSVDLVTTGLCNYVKRYAKEAERQAAACTDPKRKAELEKMADGLNWIYDNPARDYQEALQAVWFYQLGQIMDAQLHGISMGRVDQYVGKYAEADIASGKLTREEAQEITDSFMLKVTECNKLWSEAAMQSSPGYTSGQMITLGGTNKDGSDATNAATYMILASSERLKIHQPPLTLRVHEDTPEDLWEAGIACTMSVGGTPVFEWDDIVVNSMLKRGIPLEDARNYCLIGCVEPAICGCDFANSGGDGNAAYTILPNALLCAINNGKNPFKLPGDPDGPTAPETGYLYDMTSMDQVLDAYAKQMDFFTRWQVSMVNCYEYIYGFHNPLPLLSATMDGCMENGLDVLWGGAKYNGAGNSSIGHGTVADSLNIIDQMCFREKKCTTRELYDAVMANWVGYEDLHQYIKGRAAHFGNDDPEADKYLKFVADTYADGITRGVSPRGCHWTAGCWPVTLNIALGRITWATPDGRTTGEQLSDGISPVPGMDKSGPYSLINSITKFDQTKYANGTLCNMKFHPTALRGEGGWQKLRDVMKTYFVKGGMELQLNIISSETMRKAQAHPEEYQDLVVRVAGFSAYFVEVFKDAQDALIARTEISM